MNRTLRVYAVLLAAALCTQTMYPALSETIPEITEAPAPAEAENTPSSPPVLIAAADIADSLPEPKKTTVAADILEATPTPSPTPTAEPASTPAPLHTPEPLESAAPEKSAEPVESIMPEAVIEPAETPAPEVSAEPSESAAPDASIEPTESIAPDSSAESETAPDAASSPEPSPEAPAETVLPEATPVAEVSLPEISRENPRRDRSIGWKGVVQSDERGMAIPMLFQGDYRKVVCYHRGQPKSVASSGCGATSVSMVVAYLTGNTDQNPYSLFYDAVERDMYSGNGLSHSALTTLASQYGVESRWISNDADTIIKALNEGKPVIAHMGPGIFTERGHYIVLRGVTEDGKILVNDPASRSNCKKAFPIETLIKQARNSTSFMVCWTEIMPAQTPSPTPEN